MNTAIFVEQISISPARVAENVKRADAAADTAEPNQKQDYSTVLSNLSDALKILEAENASQANGAAITAISQAIKALNDPFGIVRTHKSGGLAGWQCAALRKYVLANMPERISISDLAMTVSLSTSHFCRAFRASFDCSPTQFIMKQRVERARQMLLDTNDPLSQIAFDCGFSDQSHFSRVFHDVTGETPWRWRKERNSARPAI